MSDVLVRGASTPDGRRGNLGIRGERFIAVDDLVRPAVVDADGLIALPGLVDIHTHLREPGQEAAETVQSGTAAAARGGYTAVFAMANTDPVTDTAERVSHLLHLAQGASAEVIPVGAITQGLAGETVADLEEMHELAVTHFSDDGKCVMDASVMREAMWRSARFAGVLAQHSQDSTLAGSHACFPVGASFGHDAEGATRSESTTWPSVAESVIVARDVQLSIDTGAHLHVCHVSTAETLEIIRWAKTRGAHVTCEVTPHHLLLGSSLVDADTVYKVNPPLRDPVNVEALRSGLADGTIDVVATDHAPHTAIDKAKPFPEAKPGMLGLEAALAVVIETMVNPGRLSWARVATRMSHAPARIGQIADRQGRPLAVGEPATFTLVDPTRRSVVDKEKSASLSRNNPYHGLTLPDPVIATFWAGRRTY